LPLPKRVVSGDESKDEVAKAWFTDGFSLR
jgi:hypothetical protein